MMDEAALFKQTQAQEGQNYRQEVDLIAYKDNSVEVTETNVKAVEEENTYGEQTPLPLHYRLIDKSLSQIDEDAEEDLYSHNMMSQQTPVTPIQYID